MPCAYFGCTTLVGSSLYCPVHAGLAAAFSASPPPGSSGSGSSGSGFSAAGLPAASAPSPIASASASPSGSHKRKYTAAGTDDGISTTLLPISVLFIPFDAAGQFYKLNAKKGVGGVKGVITSAGTAADVLGSKVAIAQPAPDPKWLQGAEIAAQLPLIVQQECERVRNIYVPDTRYAENLEALALSGGPGRSVASWPAGWGARVERSLKAYRRYYPILLFLSENPTKQAFPAHIDSGIPGLGYVMKYALDRGTVDGIRRVNEMAVYLREDFDGPKTPGPRAFFLSAELVTRKLTKALFKPTKDEYILKVTISTRDGHICTVAGVHLRAGLTGSSALHRKAERAALQQFCDENGIQLMVGDFNMDLQEGLHGSRGALADDKHEPRFLSPASGGGASSGGASSGGAIPEFVQQFSNASGNKHYMGFFQADTKTLRTVGVSVYAQLGASGGRSLPGGDLYYSDHPSVYVCVESTRETLGGSAAAGGSAASTATTIAATTIAATTIAPAASAPAASSGGGASPFGAGRSNWDDVD